MKITAINSRQILDSRGIPTVETEVVVESSAGQVMGQAAVPSGTSSGAHEAVELRDGGTAWGGKGVSKAIANVTGEIAQALVGKDFDQNTLDQTLNQLDGTPNKARLGANAILSVSLAFAWAASKANNQPLYQYIGALAGNTDFTLPWPMFNILNGGAHANWALDLQEYMVIPVAAKTWGERLQMGVAVYHALESLLHEKNLSTNVGHEGGFAPAVESNEAGFELIREAITKAGFRLGEQVALGIDAAASEFYNAQTQQYELKRDTKTLTNEQLTTWLTDVAGRYSLISIEDPLSEDEWAGWTQFTASTTGKLQVVGDDLLTTNPARIQQAIDQKACNALLVKPNQIGTLAETLKAMKLARAAGWQCIVSHRSGDTEDVTIAHLAVGTGCGQIKTGAPARAERTAKYNELTRIAQELGK